MTDQQSSLSVKALERRLCMALAIDPKQFDVVAGLVKPEDFEDIGARSVFEALSTVEALRRPPGDLASLFEWLQAHRFGHHTHGEGWFGWLRDEGLLTTSAHRVMHQAHSVAQASLGRRLMSELASLRCDLDTTSPVDHEAYEQLLDKSIAQIVKMIDEARKTGTTISLAEGVETIRAAPDVQPGMATGLIDLDNVIRGFHRGEVVVVAARTSQGKSTLALQMLLNAARGGAHGMIFSMEMGADQILRRAISSLSGLPLFDLRRELTGAESAAFEMACASVRDWSVTIDPVSSRTVANILATGRALKNSKGLDLLVVDYIQLVHDPVSAKLGRAAEVGAISRGLKRIAQELDCTVISVAQLNRGADRDDKPRLCHLRESGSIEHDADTVLLLHTEEDQPAVMFCDVAKNRHGECRSVRLMWHRPTYSVRNLAQGSMQAEGIYR